MKKIFTSIAFLLLLVSQLFSQADTLYLDMVHDDSLRSYILYVPADYDGTEEWPLIINLHGYAWDAPSHMLFSDMNAVADTAHFIVAYPQGLTMATTLPGFPPARLGFNLGADSLFYSPDDVDDVGFIGRLIDDVTTQYSIAPDRIYAAGFSNGGIFTHILACTDNRIAAIASVGGSLPTTSPCLSNRQVPVLQINGTADNIVNYEMGLPSLLHSVPATLDFWTSRNACEAMPTVTSLPDLNMADSSTVEYHEWSNCSAEVGLFKIFNGGHQWPGGVNLSPPLGNLNLDIHASTEIWKFFNRSILVSVSLEPILARIAFTVYPNPFADELMVEFELSHEQVVQLRLLNSLGQVVGQKIYHRLPVGLHQLPWQVTEEGLPAGLYYLQWTIDERETGMEPVLYIPH